MADILNIDKNNKLPSALDYDFLRKEGIAYIESLAGDVWTDYNTHDPGITLLEAMCYALTDLGYRTSFNIEDIIAPANQFAVDKWKQIFYTARQALPCNPLTLIDYRKLIIDTEGVKNAWIEMSNDYEVLIYLQKIKDAALPQRSYGLTYDFKKGEDVLHLRGLYKVFVEYDNEILYEKDEQLRDKKKADVEQVIWQKLHFHRNLTEDFISVSSIEYEDFAVEAIIQVSEGTDVDMINARIYKVINDFFSPPINFYSLEQMFERSLSAEEIFNGPILGHGFIDTEELEKSERFKDIHLSDIINIISNIDGVIAIKKFSFIQDAQSFFSNFTEWVSTVKDRQKKPRLDTEKSIISFERSGDRHRAPGRKTVNKERVKALLSFLQSGNFKTRLRDAGRDIPVPEGEFMDIADYYPFQKNLPDVYGMQETFIDEKDIIDKASIAIAINELLTDKIGINGAKLIGRLLNEGNRTEHLEKIIDDFLVGSRLNATVIKEIIDKVWENRKDDQAFKTAIGELIGHPGYNVNKDQVNDYIEQGLQFRNSSYKSDILYQLAAKELKKSLVKIKSSGDIARLNAAYKKYQVDMLEKRKKLVLQLRGFLMVFEQILADYLSQLSHIRDIFSFSTNTLQTFYPQLIDEINDMETLFINFKYYQEHHLQMIEPVEQFNNKRNDILDHLVARLGESMDKYSFFMLQFAGKEAPDRLIKDKISFLKDYVQISSYRAKGYDYADQNENWNSNNVEGLKKRMCRLLGIHNYKREKIAPRELFFEKITLDNKVERYIVKLVDPENREEVLMESISENSESEDEAIKDLTYILEQGYERKLYEQKGQNNDWYFELNKHTPENDYQPIARSKHYKNSNERNDAMERVITILNSFSEAENFHILDHILLRPKMGARKKGTSLEEVSLLPVEYVPEVISDADNQIKDMRYKFKIVQINNPEKKSGSLWKLSLEKNYAEFLEVPQEFDYYKDLVRRIDHIRDAASDQANYEKMQTVDGAFTFKIIHGKTTLAQSKKRYGKEEDVDKDTDDLIHFFSYEFESVNAAIDDDNPSLYADPYSFQLSIILPSWQRRFRNTTFKHLVEKTIYLETPSHIYPHVYWVNHNQMREFDEAYEVWIKEMSTNDIPATDIVNNLIAVLAKLRY